MAKATAFRAARRPWTRLGTIANGAHVFYELAAGVAMPFASRTGPVVAAAGWGTATALAYSAAGRRKESSDSFFGLLNGMYLTAVLAHFIYWPKRWFLGVPYLTECEGMRGRVVAPYNLILYISGLAAVAGMAEHGRAGARGALGAVVGVPLLLRLQDIEFRRMRIQARQHPGWWNRRLQHR
jgi:hypothetical protein